MDLEWSGQVKAEVNAAKFVGCSQMFFKSLDRDKEGFMAVEAFEACDGCLLVSPLNLEQCEWKNCGCYEKGEMRLTS